MIFRPSREQYESFMKEFSSQLAIHFPDVCFGYFGSYGKRRAVIGRADIDGFLIMGAGIVSDKKTVSGISQILARALSSNLIRTQFNLLDIESICDGRFVSYTRDYSDFLLRNSRLISGPNYHLDFGGFHFRSGVLHSAAHNFSGPGGVRNAVLYSMEVLQRDYQEFCESVEKAVDKVAKFPKKLIWLRSGKIVSSRRKSQEILEDHLNNVDYKILSEINDVLDDVNELDLRLKYPESAFKLLYNGLEVMEQMIKAYVCKYPLVGTREAVVVDNI